MEHLRRLMLQFAEKHIVERLSNSPTFQKIVLGVNSRASDFFKSLQNPSQLTNRFKKFIEDQSKQDKKR